MVLHVRASNADPNVGFPLSHGLRLPTYISRFVGTRECSTNTLLHGTHSLKSSHATPTPTKHALVSAPSLSLSIPPSTLRLLHLSLHLSIQVVNMIPDEEIREDLLLRQAALTFTRKT